MNSPTLSRLLAVSIGLLLVAACASSSAEGWTFAPPSATPAASPDGSASGSPGTSPSGSPGASGSASPGASPSESGSASPGTSPGDAIAVEETAQLQILRDGQPLTELSVAAGETYTFEVTNTADLAHNFYIGSPEDLQANLTAELEGVPDFTSGTETFEWTAPDDTSLQLEFACTVPGHYPSMHGSIVFD